LIGTLTSLPYFQAMLSGGQEYSARQLIAQPENLPLYFVSVKGSEMFDTGFYYETRLNGIIPIGTDYLGALAVGERLLLIQLPGQVDETRVSFTGTLKEMTWEYRRDVITPLESEAAGLKDVFLTVYLDVADAERPGYWVIGLLIIIGAVIGGVYMVVIGIGRLQNPARDPIMKRLSRYNVEPMQIVQRIDADMARGSQRIGKLTLSDGWILRRTSSVFDVMYIQHVVWLYKKVNTTKMYGVVTVGKTFTAVFNDQYGTTITVVGREKEVDQMLRAVAERIPWTEMGYSEATQREWSKDRDQFIAQVTARKRSFSAQ
jgi:hypothetical protein